MNKVLRKHSRINLKPRYNYIIDGEEFGNKTRDVIDRLGIRYEPDHKSFYKFITNNGITYPHWTDWDLKTDLGHIERILRNKEELERYVGTDHYRRIKAQRKFEKDKKNN